MNIYTPASTKIMHYTYADLSSRQISRPVHVVQYDDGIPILAVALYKDGQVYTIPDTANANIRLSKLDESFVYNPALGCDGTKQIVYFEITQQMAALGGEVNPIIEIEIDGLVASSGSISIIIDRNPIQNMSIESTIEFKTGQQYALEAINAAADASASKTAAKTSETNAANSKTAAANSAQQANAAYQEIVNSDIGHLEASLKKYSIYDPIYDSNGDNILDSSERILEAIFRFASSGEIMALQNKISAIETIIGNMMFMLIPSRITSSESKIIDIIDRLGINESNMNDAELRLENIEEEMIDIKETHDHLANHALLDSLY